METGTAGEAAVTVETARVVGSGPVAVALFLDSVNAPQMAADQRDGAAFAVSQLGADQITLTFYDAGANGADIGADVGTAMPSGARLLIGPSSIIASPAWAKTKAAKRPPALLLASLPAKSADGAFGLISDETDSATEVAAYAAEAGRKQILVVTPAALPPDAAARLKKTIEAATGVFLGVLISPAPMSDAGKAQLAKAEAVVVYGSKPAATLAPLREAGLKADAWILGTSEWKTEDYIDGSYFAAIDQNGFRHIAGGFQKTYGRPLSAAAAYAFDAVAVTAGIARTKGAEGLSSATLRSKAGFSGATGPFRFGNDGRVERRFSIYKVEGGVPKLHDAATAGF